MCKALDSILTNTSATVHRFLLRNLYLQALISVQLSHFLTLKIGLGQRYIVFMLHSLFLFADINLKFSLWLKNQVNMTVLPKYGSSMSRKNPLATKDEGT